MDREFILTAYVEMCVAHYPERPAHQIKRDVDYLHNAFSKHPVSITHQGEIHISSEVCERTKNFLSNTQIEKSKQVKPTQPATGQIEQGNKVAAPPKKEPVQTGGNHDKKPAALSYTSEKHLGANNEAIREQKAATRGLSLAKELDALDVAFITSLCQMYDLSISKQVRIADVLEKTGIATGTSTKVVDSLESKGYIRREKENGRTRFIHPLKRQDGNKYEALVKENGITKCKPAYSEGYTGGQELRIK